jgi:myo-inositol-1(or 4)-monophosphatase
LPKDSKMQNAAGKLRPDDLERIALAVDSAQEVLRRFVADGFETARKSGGDPVTEADLAVDSLLREMLLQPDEGWLSEETVDDPERLERSRVWIVDPLDGTKEFVTGIPEWCVSVGLVIDGFAVAGGIANPATGERVIGAVGQGVRCNGTPATVRDGDSLEGVEVLASNSEIKRGEWERFEDAEFTVRPCGSVAYKMGLVAGALGDVTWTLVPKNEWDVAAGTALVLAAGGEVRRKDAEPLRFNRRDPLLPGLLAAGPRRMRLIEERLGLPKVEAR